MLVIQDTMMFTVSLKGLFRESDATNKQDALAIQLLHLLPASTFLSFPTKWTDHACERAMMKCIVFVSPTSVASLV